MEINVTNDSYFTNIDLAKKSQKRRITLVDTIRKIRHEIPYKYCSKKKTIKSNRYGHLWVLEKFEKKSVRTSKIVEINHQIYLSVKHMHG